MIVIPQNYTITKSIVKSFCRISRKGDDNLFERDASVLESAVEVIDKMVVIVWIDKISVFFRKDIAGTYMQLGQLGILRVFDMEYIFAYKVEVFALLVPEIGIGIAVPDNLAGAFDPDGAVVGGDDDPYFFLGKPFEGIQQG